MKPRKDSADRGAGSGCMARLVRCSSFSGKPCIGILLLEFFKDFAANLLNHLRGDRTRRKHLECAVKNTFDDTETPLAHDERLGDIDASDRNGHNLRLVSGWSVGLAIRNWPCLKISFPKETGRKVDYDAKDETTNDC
jgi:hypothetical protein